MKRFISLSLAAIAFNTFAGSPEQDKIVAKYRNHFDSSKGAIWDMIKADGNYYSCNLFSVRKGSADRYSFTFKISNDGDLSIMNTILANGRFSGVPLLSEKDEVVGITGHGDEGDPLEMIAIRVGEPISMEKPMIDSWKNDGIASRIMANPLYIEISQIQEGRSVGYKTKPMATEAQLDKRYRVKEYGVCFISKENSRLNNSGRGFAGNTRSAWDATSIWGGKPYRGIGY